MVDLNKIKVLAAEKKIALGDLASQCGITHQALNKAIRTNSTSLETLEKIAHALGVSIESFFDGGVVIVDGNNDPGAGRGNIVTVTDSDSLKLLIEEMKEQRSFFASLINKRDAQIDEFIELAKRKLGI